MALQNFINERIKITSKTKSATLTPKSKEQLRSIIEQELQKQGPDADLNFIDVSGIFDMSNLFDGLQIENIKIDEWDVSNVEYMSSMFLNQKKFNCDISGWDVSNATKHDFVFLGCHKLPPEFRPKFGGNWS